MILATEERKYYHAWTWKVTLLNFDDDKRRTLSIIACNFEDAYTIAKAMCSKRTTESLGDGIDGIKAGDCTVLYTY